ncbi:MAG: ABC transporter permease, partial [Deltaproteobacteria bacterium]|nr:ABC transporter permease [Deltaproteobacteria bacterium]
TDIILSMPLVMVSIVLAAVLGPSKDNIIIIFSLMGWSRYARVLRGEVLRLSELDFVSLAVIFGCSKKRIMFRHLFPNIVNPLIIMATLQIGFIIIAESILSFLGVGVPPPDPAWGSMVAAGKNYISSAWWLSAFPGLAILLVVLSCNIFGDWLRLRLDPKFRQL